MQQRKRLIVYAQLVLWACSVLFVLVETRLGEQIPCAGMATIVVFGGLLWAIVPRRKDAYRLFCTHHTIMAYMCLLIGVGDVLNFYIPFIDYRTFDALIVLQKIVLIGSATNAFRLWVKRTIQELRKEGR